MIETTFEPKNSFWAMTIKICSWLCIVLGVFTFGVLIKAGKSDQSTEQIMFNTMLLVGGGINGLFIGYLTQMFSDIRHYARYTAETNLDIHKYTKHMSETNFQIKEQLTPPESIKSKTSDASNLGF
jgi:hypothetical protein